MILGGTCEGSVCVGQCRGHGDGDVTERRWGGGRRRDHRGPGSVATGPGVLSVESLPTGQARRGHTICDVPEHFSIDCTKLDFRNIRHQQPYTSAEKSNPKLVLDPSYRRERGTSPPPKTQRWQAQLEAAGARCINSS